MNGIRDNCNKSQNINMQHQPLQSRVSLNSISIQSSAQCGYCSQRKGLKQWVTSGFWCNKMIAKDYQQMMDRGWRRCGLYYYFPHIGQSCCQAFTIRLNTDDFQIRESQQKVLRYRNAINKLNFSGKQQIQSQQLSSMICKTSLKIYSRTSWISMILTSIKDSRNSFKNKLIKRELRRKFQSFRILWTQVRLSQIHRRCTFQERKKSFKSIEFFQINALYNQKRNQNVYQKQFLNMLIQIQFKVQIIPSKLYTLDIIKDIVENQIANEFRLYLSKKFCLATNILALLCSRINNMVAKHTGVKLRIQTSPAFSKWTLEFLERCRVTYKPEAELNLLRNMQVLINSKQIELFRVLKRQIKFYLQTKEKQTHENNRKKNGKKGYKIKIKWSPAQFDDESYALYEEYQSKIHGKKMCSKESYHSFLCQNALEKGSIKQNEQELQLGCWHMKYYLQDQLIAVGVVDVMEDSLSSVYFFYDPAYKKYSLGVYGALMELEYMKQQQLKGFNNFKNYYLGYYIQDSPKMVYKGEYKRSQLLCPITMKWVELTSQMKQKVTKVIDELKEEQGKANKIIKLNENDEQGELFQYCDQFINEKVKIRVQNRDVKLPELKPNYSKYFLSLFRQLMPLLGPKLAETLIFSYNR